MARGCWLVGVSIVVIRNHVVDVRSVDPPIKASDVGSGQWVPGCAVSSEIGAEDFARPDVRIRHDQRSRERAPEMGHDAQLQSSRKVCISPERKLVLAVQNGGTEIPIDASVVQCARANILIRCGWADGPIAETAARILEPG